MRLWPWSSSSSSTWDIRVLYYRHNQERNINSPACSLSSSAAMMCTTSVVSVSSSIFFSTSSSSQRVHTVDKMCKSMQRICMVLVTAVLVFVTSSGVNNEVLGRCPKECQCFNLQVDCSQRGLHQVPRGIPRNAEKM